MQLTSFDRALVDYAVDRSQPRRIDGVLLTKFDTVDDKVGGLQSDSDGVTSCRAATCVVVLVRPLTSSYHALH